eukprot:7176297-Prymnesium_polylepis.1
MCVGLDDQLLSFRKSRGWHVHVLLGAPRDPREFVTFAETVFRKAFSKYHITDRHTRPDAT